jgi:hypothetical protein
MDEISPLQLKNIRINHSPSPVAKSPRSVNNASKSNKKPRTQQLIFSKMPLSMKKQFLHILRTNDIEFKPSIRHGFVETRICMTDNGNSKSPTRSSSKKVFIGKKEYQRLLGHKYG